ncbi:MAG TPA: hypothetical protein VGU22_12655 [Methylomirabilota bacterium]|jgi:hypothetical protein|nr:hypothetical protein [Methylomirabilota bacterium]
MAHARSAQTLPEAPSRPHGQGRALFFKEDRARGIDRYIDYFDGSPSQAAAGDPCGERLLESAR